MDVGVQTECKRCHRRPRPGLSATKKLDDIVTDEWREPPEYIEPLTGARHGKIRVGDFRLGAEANHRTETIVVFSIDHRSGAYEPGDD